MFDDHDQSTDTPPLSPPQKVEDSSKESIDKMLNVMDVPSNMTEFDIKPEDPELNQRTSSPSKLGNQRPINIKLSPSKIDEPINTTITSNQTGPSKKKRGRPPGGKNSQVVKRPRRVYSPETR